MPEQDAIDRAASALSELASVLDSESVVDGLERLSELSHLLATTAATVDRLLKRKHRDQSADPADCLAALSLHDSGDGGSESDGSISVGHRVYFKSASGQPPISGRVTEVFRELAYSIRDDSGKLYERWPAKSVKLPKRSGPPEPGRAKVGFALGKKKGAGRDATAPATAAPAPAALTVTTPAAAPPPTTAVPAPEPLRRMPRVWVVLDTNEFLPQGGAARAGHVHVPLQQFVASLRAETLLGVTLAVAVQVQRELDRLKASSDEALAKAARAANRLLREGAEAGGVLRERGQVGEAWLQLEEHLAPGGAGGGGGGGSGGGGGGGAPNDGLAPDERIVRHAVALAATLARDSPSDRVVLATEDNNCATRALGAGVAALSLSQVVFDAEQRSDSWRRAYLQGRAADAIEAGAWRAHGA